MRKLLLLVFLIGILGGPAVADQILASVWTADPNSITQFAVGNEYGNPIALAVGFTNPEDYLAGRVRIHFSDFDPTGSGLCDRPSSGRGKSQAAYDQ